MTLTIEEAGTTAFPIQGESLYLRALKDFSAGWVGGLAQVLSGQPFDTIKVRLQTQPSGLDSLAKPGVPRYTGALDCALQTLRSEGLAGFYRGTLMPLLGVGFCVSIQFGALEGMKRLYASMETMARREDVLQARNNPIPLQLTWSQLFVSGTVAGLANSIVAGPVEHIRIRCQAAATLEPPSTFKGPLDCLSQIYKAHGVRGLYKGQVSAMLRDGLGFGAYFLTYEYLVQQAVTGERLRQVETRQAQGLDGLVAADALYRRENIAAWKLISFGALAGLAFWIPVFPVDVIKSKLQTDSFEPKFKRYTGIFQCASSIFRNEGGLVGFFKGFTPCFLRAAPVNAATFLAFELAMRTLE